MYTRKPAAACSRVRALSSDQQTGTTVDRTSLTGYISSSLTDRTTLPDVSRSQKLRRQRSDEWRMGLAGRQQKAIAAAAQPRDLRLCASLDATLVSPTWQRCAGVLASVEMKEKQSVGQQALTGSYHTTPASIGREAILAAKLAA